MDISKQYCNPTCTPFIIFVVLSVLGLVSAIAAPEKEVDGKKQSKLMTISLNIRSSLVLGALIYWLCYNCHTTIAWVVLLLPLIITVVFMGLFFSAAGVAIFSRSK